MNKHFRQTIVLKGDFRRKQWGWKVLLRLLTMYVSDIIAACAKYFKNTYIMMVRIKATWYRLFQWCRRSDCSFWTESICVRAVPAFLNASQYIATASQILFYVIDRWTYKIEVQTVFEERFRKWSRKEFLHQQAKQEWATVYLQI